MRTVFASILVALSIATPRALAGDVAYKLETTSVKVANVRESMAPHVIEIRDRIWEVCGAEDLQQVLEAPKKFESLTAQQFRTGTTWLDEVARPRTRELFGIRYAPGESDSRQFFYYGRIAIQR